MHASIAIRHDCISFMQAEVIPYTKAVHGHNLKLKCICDIYIFFPVLILYSCKKEKIYMAKIL